MKELVVRLAFPSDVREDASFVSAIIGEVSEVTQHLAGIRIECQEWIGSTAPARSTDPQEVINQQLASDPDILIVLMWTRLGTPTPRASSGTVEEYERALSRDSGVRIGCFFSSRPVSPSAIVPEQLLAVEEFKRRVAKDGCLYREYSDLRELGRLFRLLLLQEISRGGTEPPDAAELVGEYENLSNKIAQDLDELTLVINKMGALQKHHTLQTERLTATIRMGMLKLDAIDKTVATQTLDFVHPSTQLLNDRRIIFDRLIKHYGDLFLCSRTLARSTPLKVPPPGDFEVSVKTIEVARRPLLEWQKNVADSATSSSVEREIAKAELSSYLARLIAQHDYEMKAYRQLKNLLERG